MRLTPGELVAWKAGLEPGESLSDLLRSSVEAELARRVVEEERQAAVAADPVSALDELLARSGLGQGNAGPHGERGQTPPRGRGPHGDHTA